MESLNFDLADILEIDSISDQDDLTNIDTWDSLAILSLLAVIDQKFNVQLTNMDLETARNLRDIKTLIESYS